MKEKTITKMRGALLCLAVACAAAFGALWAGAIQPAYAWADDAAQTARVAVQQEDTTAQAIAVSQFAGEALAGDSAGDGAAVQSLTPQVVSTQAITPQATGTTTDGWAYSATTTSVTLTGYTGTSLTPVVPATVSGLPVTGVIVNAGAGAPAITSINLSAAAGTLASLKIYGCALTSLDLSSCTKLAYVDVRANKLTSLKLGSTSLLTTLFCSSNSLTTLDMSGCTSLVKLVCYSNSLTSLNVSKCSLLEYLDCHTNKLTGLSVGANLKLTDCFCYDNYISEDLYALTQRFGTEQNVILPQNSVVKTDISSGTVAAIADQTYTGSALTPAVTLTVSGKTLVAGTDYTVVYSNNTAVGTATVTITGIGGYTGTKTATFSIVSPPTSATVVRLWGDSSLDTMKQIVDAGSFTKGGTVVVATDGGYYDALTASALAGVSKGCVLLTNGGKLSSQTAAELKALAPSNVVVVGGPGAVSETVRGQIAAAAGLASSKVSRVYGGGATDTADAIWEEAKAEGLSSDTCIIATSDDFKDALSVAPAAYAKGYPIFLAGPHATLSAHTLSTIKAAGFTKAVVIGGIGALPTAKIDDVLKAKTGITSVSRYWGKSCFQTSSAVANWEISDLGMSANNLAVATADSYPDALCGAALCGKNNAILVLAVPSDTSCITGVVHANKASVSRAYLFGGAGVLPDKTIKDVLVKALA